jgi:hypothetical protein
MDATGVQHYQYEGPGMITDAIRDALRTRPDGVCWFWWNGTFAPMLVNEITSPEEHVPGEQALYRRWLSWREHHHIGGSFLPLLQQLSQAQ